MAGSSMRVGDVEIIAVQDSHFPCPTNVGFPSVAKETWEQLAPDVAATGVAQLTIGCFAVRAPGMTVVVDTGIGPAGAPGFGIGPGRLPDALKEAGIAPEDVDAVLITHLHIDHVGWNARLENGVAIPTFPRARYYFGRRDYEFFTAADQIEGSAFLKVQAVPLVEQGRAELYDAETRLGGTITLIATPGHTPGHATVGIASGDEHGFILGDVAHHPAQVGNPGIRAGFDADGEEAQRSREALWERLTSLGAKVAAGHFPPPGFGRVVLTEGRRLWQAL